MESADHMCFGEGNHSHMAFLHCIICSKCQLPAKLKKWTTAWTLYCKTGVGYETKTGDPRTWDLGS